MVRPFHLALPTTDLAATRRFYLDILGCTLGREGSGWIDLDLCGHQLVFHDCDGQSLPTLYNPVDRHQVPLPHFGIILEPDAFARFAKRLEGQGHFYHKTHHPIRGHGGGTKNPIFQRSQRLCVGV